MTDSKTERLRELLELTKAIAAAEGMFVWR